MIAALSFGDESDSAADSGLLLRAAAPARQTDVFRNLRRDNGHDDSGFITVESITSCKTEASFIKQKKEARAKFWRNPLAKVPEQNFNDWLFRRWLDSSVGRAED